MERDDVVYLNDKGAERLKNYAASAGMRGKVTGPDSPGKYCVVLDALNNRGAFILPLDCLTPAGYARRDIVEAVQDVVRDNAEQLRRVDHGEVLIKIQDGRPVFMDITYKSKLK